MEKSNVEVIDDLKKEVSRLKSKIGGYKKANENYRKQVKDLLMKQALSIKNTPELETKLIELERANETIQTKSAIIEAFQKKCEGLIIENKALANKVAALNDVLAESEKTIFELRKPWWKRIF